MPVQAAQLPAVPSAAQRPIVQSVATLPDQASQLPTSVQLPYAHLNGTAAVPGGGLPSMAQQIAQRAPEPGLAQPEAQPSFRADMRLPSQTDPVVQAHNLPNPFPRQFLPQRYPPQSFFTAQQNARIGGGVTASTYSRPSLPVQSNPMRPTLTPTPTQAPNVAAATMSAIPPVSHVSPHVSQHPYALPAAAFSPDVVYHRSSTAEPMQEDSDTAPDNSAVHAEWQELVEHARSTLPVAYRSDGPQLAFIFDDPPSPDGQGAEDADAPIKRKRVMVDGYEMEDDGEDGMNFKKARINPGQFRRPPSAGKSGREDAERRAYREAERASLLAKRVEQTMQKDKERMEREKKRVKEKLEREKKKDEVAQSKAAEKLRQLQIREAKKAAEKAVKEQRAEERKRLQDEKRREKELLRALAAQERQATRLRQRDVNTGPRDDLDIEWEQLMEAHHEAGYGSGTEDQPDHGTSSLPERPEFPPPSLNMVPAFAADLPAKQGSDMLMVCAFLHSFSSLLGLTPMTVDSLLQAVADGVQSQLLGEIHIALLRLLQMDLEEAHATGAIQGGGATNFMDRAIINCAHALEEAWAWGFDVDVWRAHLNAQTWPEILRQYSIAMGLGQKRPKPKEKQERKTKLGTEGEDVVKDESGQVTLVAPARFGLGTVKGAAYKVLQDVGPEGLTIAEIARRIQEQGLRDLSTSKTPEASVAGALSRDVIFARVAPATYALKAHIALRKSGANAVKEDVKAEEVKTEAGQTEVKAEDNAATAEQQGAVKSEAGQHPEEQDETDSEPDSDDDDEYEGKVDPGHSWLQHLKTREYDDLSFEERVNVLRTLTHMALDGPAVRAALDGRIEEAQRIRKQMYEDAKIEKRRRQQEAAEKAKKSAEDAQRALDAYNAQDSPHHDPYSASHAHTGETTGSATDAQQQQAHNNAGASTSGAHANDGEDEMSAAAASKQRQQQRADNIKRAEEVHAIRGEPLGSDRRHNRYWRIAVETASGAESDASTGRVLFESHQNGTWWLLGHSYQLQHLLASLERKGAREGALHSALLRQQSAIEQAMPAMPIQRPLNPQEQSQHQRSQLELQHHSCLWSLTVQALLYLSGADPVSSLPVSQGEASGLAKLRADMLRVEAALPLSAMKDANWNSNAWQAAVKGADSALQLRQLLGELEVAVHEGFLWRNHAQPRQPLLIKGAWMPIGHASAAVEVANPTDRPISAAPVEPAIAATPAEHLNWLPATCAAVSLRLFAIDSAIIYRPGDQPGRETLQAYKYIQRPAETPMPGKVSEVLEPRASSHAVSSPHAAPGAMFSHSRPAQHSLFPPFPQAALQGPRQNFRLPAADFKQAVLDAQSGIGSSITGLKIRLPISKGGPASKPRGSGPASRLKSSGQVRASMGNGKAGSKKASKAASLQQQVSEGDVDMEELTGRSNTATPGPSEDDIQSPGRSVDEEPEISSEDEQPVDSDVELSD